MSNSVQKCQIWENVTSNKSEQLFGQLLKNFLDSPWQIPFKSLYPDPASVAPLCSCALLLSNYYLSSSSKKQALVC